MRDAGRFDEVMIVNPGPAGGDPATGERIMMGYYGYPGGFANPYEYADAPYQVGSDEMDYAGVENGMGCSGCSCGRNAAAPLGYYADPYGLAWPGYGFASPHAGYGFGFAAPYGYAPGYGQPYDGYGQQYDAYGQQYEMEGYDEYADDEAGDYAEYAEDEEQGVDGYGWYGSDDFDGYVQDGASRFNYTVPGTVAGYAEDNGVEGYTPPRDVSPSCGSFKATAPAEGDLPDTLKPLW